jgi:aminopeptidase N
MTGTQWQLSRLALTTLLVTNASGAPHERERLRTYDVLHYSLAVTIDEQSRTVSGSVAMKLVALKPLTVIEVDAAEMTITQVASSPSSLPLRFKHVADKLLITPAAPLRLHDTLECRISYFCSPRLGLYFFRPDSGYPDRPWQVWSQGENEDNHFWFPCYDYPNDKASVEIRATVRDSFMAISNGALVDITDHPETRTRTFRWYNAKPISSYLISLVVGDYTRIEETYKAIPVQYYVYPHQNQDARRSFGKTLDMMKFFSERIGYDYPWQKYAQTVVTDFIYGGMENASATTLTDKTIHSERAHLDVSSDNLVAHELAHQWFGNLVTCRNWSHSWLNEGFASFFQAVYVEHDRGLDDYQFDIMEKQRSVVESDTGMSRRPTVTDRYVDPFDLFDSRIYARGAVILHMLRNLLGEQMFWSGIKHYLDLYQYDAVSTADFQNAMEEEAGRSLDEFFDQWLYRAGFPEFRVSQRYDADAGTLHLVVHQTQRVDSLTPYYRVPVAIEVSTSSGATAYPVTIEAQPKQTISLSVPTPPLNVVFDKSSSILKTLKHTKPTESWLYQLRNGDCADRVAALSGLTPMIHHKEVRGALAHVLRADPFWGVRKRAAEALRGWRDSSLLTLLLPALTDTEAKVRVAAVESMQHVLSSDAVDMLRRVLRTDSSYAVVAQAVQSLALVDGPNGLKHCEIGLGMDSHNDIIRSGAAKALGTLKSAESKRLLIELTAYGHSSELRRAAIEALADNWRTDDVRQCLERLTSDGTQRVRRKAVEKLGTIASRKSRSILQRILRTSPDSILRREARLALVKIERGL